MKKELILLFLIPVFICQNSCRADEPNDWTQIKSIIENLNRTAETLKYFSAKVEYSHLQTLFETQTVRTGKVFYVKDANFCALRINFTTMKQEDSSEQKYKEDYIFDGWKMTKIDYQSKSAVSETLANEKSIEPFELVQNYFPIIGFARPAEMSEQFDIKLLENKSDLITLLIKPKEQTRFYKIYEEIEIKIDPKKSIPFDFSASTSENEKIKISFTQIDIKNKVKRDVFNVDIPKNFSTAEKSPDDANF